MKSNLFDNGLPSAVPETAHKHRQSVGERWLWISSVILCLVFIFVLARLIALWNYQPVSKKIKPVQSVGPTQVEQVGSLPSSSDNIIDAVALGDANFQADQLVFNQIYQTPTTSWSVAILANQAQSPKLPLNIKSEAANYYDIRRHYNLEPVVGQLNQQGAVLIDNPFGKPEQDFFSFYQSANRDQWPVILTNDAIFYYYQNNLKETYKALEAGFYDGLWQISVNLFDLANRRYQAALNQMSSGNDPLLEAYRLNAQYWAVTLKLLAPKASQINQDGLTTSLIAFRPGDDQIYKMPSLDSDLGREVDQEVALIQAAKDKQISPLFGQPFDYSFFTPDNSYQGGGRLANFSLASKWLGRDWPTYYRGPNCPDCQLDKDDWRINFLAVNVLVRDLASNQAFKNYWAKIYKTISYFAGLRDELTYVHYDRAQKEVLAGQSLEQVARLDKDARDRVLDQLQATILKNNFSVIDGGWDRQKAQDRAKVGLRILQDRYWPGQAIDWPKVSSTLDIYIGKQQSKDWQVNQFWSSLELLKIWLANSLTPQKLWLKPAWWREQQLALAKFYLLNWQLPADQWSSVLPDSGLAQDSRSSNGLVSIDTNGLSALDRQIAAAKMLRLALAKLQVSNLLSEQKLGETIATLQTIRDLAAKQAAGQSWTREETDSLNNFFQHNLIKAGRKTLSEKPSKKDVSLQRLRARLEVRILAGQPRILIGPVLMP